MGTYRTGVYQIGIYRSKVCTGRTVCVYTHDFLMNTYSTALVEYDQAVSSSSARSDIYTSTGANGKLRNLHVQIVKAAWDYLSKLLQ